MDREYCIFHILLGMSVVLLLEYVIIPVASSFL